MNASLDRILDRTRARLTASRRDCSSADLRARCAHAAPTRSLAAALRRGGEGAPLRVLAELKRQSPSAGPIRAELDVVAVANELAALGCAALSVLTEPDFFGGSLADLQRVRAAVSLPLLRKDFILDSYQLLEARAHGADAVLLLAAVHDEHALRELAAEAAALGLEVLAEAHGEAELDCVLQSGLPLVGLNSRDLRDFSVDLERIFRWQARVPPDRVLVAESGVQQRSQVERIAAAGFDALLIGEALMRGEPISARFRELFGVTR